MDEIKLWALSICISSVAGGIFYVLAPKGSLNKSVKLVITVFLLTCVFLPFSYGKIDFAVDEEEFYSENKYSRQLENNIIKNVKEIVRKNISDILENRKYNYKSIDIITDKDDDAGIYIKEIIIILPKKYIGNAYKIKEEIKYKTGYDVRVEYENS